MWYVPHGIYRVLYLWHQWLWNCYRNITSRLTDAPPPSSLSISLMFHSFRNIFLKRSWENYMPTLINDFLYQDVRKTATLIINSENIKLRERSCSAYLEVYLFRTSPLWGFIWLLICFSYSFNFKKRPFPVPSELPVLIPATIFMKQCTYCPNFICPIHNLRNNSPDRINDLPMELLIF